MYSQLLFIPSILLAGMMFPFSMYICEAREEAELSQSELAQLIFRRRATVSDLETGKSQADAITISLLALALERPLTFFFPKIIRENLNQENLALEEQELLLILNKLDKDDRNRLTAQAKALLKVSKS